MIRKLKTLTRLFYQQGVSGVLYTLLKKAFPSNNPFFSWESRNLFECAAEQEKNIELNQSNYQTIPFSDQNIQPLIGLNAMTEKSINDARNNNETCWLVKDKDQIVAYVWIRSKANKISSDTGYYFPINSQTGAYWWRDLYVLPPYRGKNLVSQLFKSWLKSFTTGRRESIYTEISPNNIASIKVHKKLGFRQFAQLKMICFMGMRFYFLNSNGHTHLNYRFCFTWLY